LIIIIIASLPPSLPPSFLASPQVKPADTKIVAHLYKFVIWAKTGAGRDTDPRVVPMVLELAKAMGRDVSSLEEVEAWYKEFRHTPRGKEIHKKYLYGLFFPLFLPFFSPSIPPSKPNASV
jgi:hypothetical protein